MQVVLKVDFTQAKEDKRKQFTVDKLTTLTAFCSLTITEDEALRTVTKAWWFFGRIKKKTEIIMSLNCHCHTLHRNCNFGNV